MLNVWFWNCPVSLHDSHNVLYFHIFRILFAIVHKYLSYTAVDSPYVCRQVLWVNLLSWDEKKFTIEGKCFSLDVKYNIALVDIVWLWLDLYLDTLTYWIIIAYKYTEFYQILQNWLHIFSLNQNIFHHTYYLQI